MTIENLKKANTLNNKIESIKREIAVNQTPGPFHDDMSALTHSQSLQIQALYLGFLETNIKEFQDELDKL